jgi:phage-related minor tail protein
MGTDNTLWLEAVINKLERQARRRRNYPKGNWDGYSSELSPMLGTKESIGNDISRRERMAEAMYDI